MTRISSEIRPTLLNLLPNYSLDIFFSWSDMQISYLICIFINTDEISENKGKLKKKSKYKLNSAPKLSLLHVIILSVIQFDKSFHPIVI